MIGSFTDLIAPSATATPIRMDTTDFATERDVHKVLSVLPFP